MANLFKVRLNKTSENFEQLFGLAFQDIYNLAKKMYSSEDSTIKGYLYAYAEESWMVLDNESITLEIDGYVTISKNDIQGQTRIEYDFGKRSPTDDSFIFAIMSIFYHYLPETEFYEEVTPYSDSFDEGVILARLVNDQIKNPFMNDLIPIERLIVNEYTRKVYLALAGNTTHKKVRFYREK